MSDMFTKDIEEVTLNPVEMKDEELLNIKPSVKVPTPVELSNTKVRDSIRQTNVMFHMPNPDTFANILNGFVDVLATGNFTKTQVEQIANYISTNPEVYGFEKNDKLVAKLSQVKAKVSQAYIDLGLTNEIKYGDKIKEIESPVTKAR